MLSTDSETEVKPQRDRGTAHLRIFKPFSDERSNENSNRVVFIVRRAQDKVQCGQIVWYRHTLKAYFHSSIAEYKMSALCEIIGFLNSLESGNVDLIIDEFGEVKI